MIYVGIDIAKLNHFASTFSFDGKTLNEPFKFVMTVMASICWSRSSIRLTQSPTASSSVLNQRHTMATTSSGTLSLKISRCVLNTIKTSTMRNNTSAKRRLIRLTFQ